MFRSAALTGRRVASSSERILNRGSGRLELRETLVGERRGIAVVETRGNAEADTKIVEINIFIMTDFILLFVSDSWILACVQSNAVGLKRSHNMKIVGLTSLHDSRIAELLRQLKAIIYSELWSWYALEFAPLTPALEWRHAHTHCSDIRVPQHWHSSSIDLGKTCETSTLLG